jgi:hypothetical protein
MSDEIQITGSVNLVEVCATLNHVVIELERLGKHVLDEGKDNRKRFDDIRSDMARNAATLRSEIAALDKAQTLTDRELKWLIAKVSAFVSAVVVATGWLIKSGVLEILR